MCHDVDHRGINNAFLLKTEHPLGLLYANGSVLEYHHSYMTDLLLEVSKQFLRFNLSHKVGDYFVIISYSLIYSFYFILFSKEIAIYLHL